MVSICTTFTIAFPAYYPNPSPTSQCMLVAVAVNSVSSSPSQQIDGRQEVCS